jgi:2'-5' RNA ligase
MIALVPSSSEWCHRELPHMTLVYAGPTDKLNPADFNEMGKTVLDLARRFTPPVLDVAEPKIFGGVEDGYVDVLTLKRTQDIDKMRSEVEGWNASKHPFAPHVTVGPAGSLEGEIPKQILFDKIMLAWGDRKLVTAFNNKQ